MTATETLTTTTAEPALNFDEGTIAMNIAYMMLYATYHEGEPCWPAYHFDAPGAMPDIEPLLVFGHAEPFEAGYRITDAGRAYWENHRKRWIESTSRGAGLSATSHGTLLLMHLADGQWRLGKTFPATIRNSARYEMLNAGAIELDREERSIHTRYRITKYGWSRLLKLDLVKAEDEPDWTAMAQDQSA